MSGDPSEARTRLLLNVGAGPRENLGVPACFAGAGWSEIRLDLDTRVEPDIVGSVVDLSLHFADGSVDAIWSSHNIEHLFDHEAAQALEGFRRVLKRDGFALITCPDLEAVAEGLLRLGPDGVAYHAPVGPITIHDMIFGHGASIAGGNRFMAHRTGFTQERLGCMAVRAGFGGVRVGRGSAYDLWALLPMPDCDMALLETLLDGTRLAFLFSDRDA